MSSKIYSLSKKLRCPKCFSINLLIDENIALCNSCMQSFPISNSIIDFLGTHQNAGTLLRYQPGLFEKQRLYEFINFSLLGLLKRTDIDINRYINGKEILDIGCGPKPYFYNPEAASFHVGIDVSWPFVRRSSEILPKSNFAVASADSLPFTDNSFDIILILFTLHHIPIKHSQLIKEAYRVSREKIIVFDHNQSSKGVKRILKEKGWKMKDKGFKYNTQEEWDELLHTYKVEEKKILGGFLENIFEFVITK